MTNTETGSTIVVADRFPVMVIDAGGEVVHTAAKMVMTRPDADGVGRLLIYSAPDNPLYDVQFYRSSSDIGSQAKDWTLDTSVGRVVVRSAGGCGCGNRLKGWTPQELQPYRLGRMT